MIWTGERNRQQGRLVAGLYRSAAGVPCERSAVIAGGLPGADKDAALDRCGVDRSRYLTVSIDAVLDQMAGAALIPESDGLSPLMRAGQVHAEAQHVAKRVLLRAMMDGRNLILDMSLASWRAAEAWTYALRFELQGFQPFVRQNIVVTQGSTLTVDATLEVASLTESITVTGDSPMVDTTTTKVGATFSGEALVGVPSSTDLWGNLAQTPGVRMQGYDVGGSHKSQQTGYDAFGMHPAFVAFAPIQITTDLDSFAPGVQTDVRVRTSLLLAEIVTLDVLATDGTRLSTESLAVDAQGEAAFNDVTVPTPRVVLRASGRGVCGEAQDEITADVAVGTLCALALDPAPEVRTFYAPFGVLNAQTDPDPVAPGYQATLRVASQPMRRPAIANDFDMTPSEMPRVVASAPAGSRSASSNSRNR